MPETIVEKLRTKGIPEEEAIGVAAAVISSAFKLFNDIPLAKAIAENVTGLSAPEAARVMCLDYLHDEPTEFMDEIIVSYFNAANAETNARRSKRRKKENANNEEI